MLPAVPLKQKNANINNLPEWLRNRFHSNQTASSISGSIHMSYWKRQEVVLPKYSGIMDVAIVGVADLIYGKKDKVLLVVEERIQPEGLLGFSLEQLPRYMSPQYL